MAGSKETVYIKADRNVEVAKTSVMIGPWNVQIQQFCRSLRQSNFCGFMELIKRHKIVSRFPF